MTKEEAQQAMAMIHSPGFKILQEYLEARFTGVEDISPTSMSEFFDRERLLAQKSFANNLLPSFSAEVRETLTD